MTEKSKHQSRAHVVTHSTMLLFLRLVCKWKLICFLDAKLPTGHFQCKQKFNQMICYHRIKLDMHIYVQTNVYVIHP
jgi:hypothetical protein